jgi:fusion and transport protein UGO1
MPWEVGKLLLQVQWVPRDAGEPEPLYAEDDHEEAVRFFFFSFSCHTFY